MSNLSAKNQTIPYNVRVKYYPTKDGLRPYQIIICNKTIFTGEEKKNTTVKKLPPKVAEACEALFEGKYNGLSETEEIFDPDSAIRNYKAAHRRLYDKIQSNPQLNLFVTLTLNENEISRTDYDNIISKLNVWLANRVRRDGLAYILVPEYHKDGISIHFHGLMNENGLNLVNSHHKDHGKTIYNITDFPYGFTTAKRVSNPKNGNSSDAISKYVHKYMTKALKNAGEDPDALRALKIGGRYYLSGGALQQPYYKYAKFDFNEVDAEAFEIKDIGMSLKILTADNLTFSSLLNQLGVEN